MWPPTLLSETGGAQVVEQPQDLAEQSTILQGLSRQIQDPAERPSGNDEEFAIEAMGRKFLSFPEKHGDGP